MVKQGNYGGLFDWLVQRCTAILIGVYAIFLLLYLLTHADLSYEMWEGLFNNAWMQVATILVAISILWHAWIGIWTVLTDYVKLRPLRLLLEIIVILLLLVYFIWILESLLH